MMMTINSQNDFFATNPTILIRKIKWNICNKSKMFTLQEGICYLNVILYMVFTYLHDTSKSDINKKSLFQVDFTTCPM